MTFVSDSALGPTRRGRFAIPLDGVLTCSMLSGFRSLSPQLGAAAHRLLG